VALTELANSQHGVVARRQLGALGLSATMVRDRIERGLLRRLHRGVYAVGHRRLTTNGHALAAVLAIGPGAVLSHRDAARLHDLRPGNHRQTDVTTTRRGCQSTDSIRVHRTTVLTPADVTTVNGIPVTSVARTLVDLAGVVPLDHLAKAVNEAERLRIFDLSALEAAMGRTQQRTGGGHRAIAAALARYRERRLELTRIETETSSARSSTRAASRARS
jgi:predicted transcriptional regulator of viral defense system